MKMTISEKDKRLLFLLFSLIFVACSYFFVYLPNLKKAEVINTENETLQAKLNELTTMAAKEGDVKTQTQEMTNKIGELELEFPAQINTEDVIITLNDIEETAQIKITSAEFTMNQVLSTPVAEPVPQTTPDATTESTPATNTATATGDQGKTADTTALTGYKTSVIVSFQATYDGLKKTIDYVSNNKNRMVINDLSTAYDSTTGNLSGTMTINFYSVSGMNKEYSAPNVPGIETGVDNIFGTVEINTEN